MKSEKLKIQVTLFTLKSNLYFSFYDFSFFT